MLAPRATATRERKSLDGLWRFALDAAGRAQGWQDGLPAGARQMPVPASYNDVFPEPEVHDHVGDVWYETLVRVPARWAGERIVLRFGSATHRAVVWVNGRQVAEHEGGYTPFEADVTGVVESGAENRVTVVVNNVLTWQSIPPGDVEKTPDGPRQRYFHDFFKCAGLHRPVWLYTTPEAHSKDVVADLVDVVMLNGYYGWYVNTGDLPAAERALEAELNAWADKPISMTEYGADTISGLHGVVPAPWTEEYQVEMLAMSHRRPRPMIHGTRPSGGVIVGLLPGRGTARRRLRRWPAPASPGPERRLPPRPALPWPFRSPRGHLWCRPP
jgi:beta-galactosidase/beta-glucuronidase